MPSSLLTRDADATTIAPTIPMHFLLSNRSWCGAMPLACKSSHMSMQYGPVNDKRLTADTSYGSSALSKQAATATSTSSASVTASSTISTAVQTGAPLSSLSGDAVVTPTRAADIVAITAAGAAAANSGDEKSRKTSDGAVKEGKVSVGKLLAGLVLFGALFA